MNDKELTSSYPTYTIGRQNHKFFVPYVDQYTVTATAYSDRAAKKPGISYQVTLSFTRSSPSDAAKLGDSDVKQTDNARLYPIPATTGEIMFESSHLKGDESLRLISSTGVVMQVYNITEGQKQVPINTRGLKTGVYLLQVNYRDKIVTHKVLVQNE